MDLLDRGTGQDRQGQVEQAEIADIDGFGEAALLPAADVAAVRAREGRIFLDEGRELDQQVLEPARLRGPVHQRRGRSSPSADRRAMTARI